MLMGWGDMSTHRKSALDGLRIQVSLAVMPWQNAPVRYLPPAQVSFFLSLKIYWERGQISSPLLGRCNTQPYSGLDRLS